MKHTNNIEGTTDAWEEGILGADEQFVRRATPDKEREIDAALGLQMISIRLPSELLKDLKIIAQLHNVGYQPLIRDALERFARAELKQIAIEYANEKIARAREKSKKLLPPTPNESRNGHDGKKAA
ncbi:MAG: hypothetical protein V4634_03720 [Pseudomonadota bacterium]